MAEQLLREDLIDVQINATNKEELLKKMAKKLEAKGYVKDSFYEGLITREKTYPTGLNVGAINVSVPHTDVCHVNKPAIAVATLETPILFKNMGDPKADVSVRLVFMLVVKNPKKQVPLLTNLMAVFGEKEVLEELVRAKNSNEVYQILEHILEEKGE